MTKRQIYDHWWTAWFFALCGAAAAHDGSHKTELICLLISVCLAVSIKLKVENDGG